MKNIIELEYNNFFNKDLDNPLRKTSEHVSLDDTEIQQDLKDLKKVFDSYKISVGISAPQIGINKRIVIINFSKKEKKRFNTY